MNENTHDAMLELLVALICDCEGAGTGADRAREALDYAAITTDWRFCLDGNRAELQHYTEQADGSCKVDAIIRRDGLWAR